jgi:aldose 1-epimerase
MSGITVKKEVLDSLEGASQFILEGEGLAVTVTNFGATLVSLRVPDRAGVLEEVTLNYSADELVRRGGSNPYYGCTVGRVANRIAGGKFSLDGVEYSLAVNNGPNALHGGIKGFDKQLWVALVLPDGVAFTYVSVDGEEGYPGTLTATVTYRLLAGTGALRIDYEATTDAPTVVNLTNHTYFNLSGGLREDVRGHLLQLSCARYLPVDKSGIPTGELEATAGGPFDFASESALGLAIDGIGERETNSRLGVDHCFCVDGDGDGCSEGVAEGDERLRPMATLTHPGSGRRLTLSGTQPGVQVYTGNWLSLNAADAPHVQHNAVALETQGFPDAVNRPGLFPSVVLRPGETYSHTALFSFSVVA